MESYQDFFDLYARCFGPLAAVQTPRTPPEMIVGPAPCGSKGWIQWRYIPCGDDVIQKFGALERGTRSTFPPSFKRWYCTNHTLDMDAAIVRLPANPSNAP